jgi:SagB-type dehydrogenase family enzyme
MPGSILSLPECTHRGPSFEEVLAQRRSVRRYAEAPLTLAQLGQLLFAAQGATPDEKGRPLRTTPSAGGTYPLEVLVFARDVTDLPAGLYRHLPDVHGLRLLATGDLSTDLKDACLSQPWVARAQAVLIVTGVPERIRPRYGDRSTQYIYFEAGQLTQNVLLQATSLGLGTVPIGAFTEQRLQDLLHLDPAWESVLFVIPVGPLPE